MNLNIFPDLLLLEHIYFTNERNKTAFLHAAFITKLEELDENISAI